MPLRRLWIVLGFLLLPAVASADGHRAGLFGGGSYLRGSSLWGVHASGDWAPFTYRKFIFIGDLSVHSGTHDGADVTIKTFMGGGGWAFPKGDHVVTLHGLGGGVRGGGSRKVGAVGGSYAFVAHRLAAGWQKGIGVQVDRILIKEADDFWRVSAGVVIRYKPN